jgi:hypothetical protein
VQRAGLQRQFEGGGDILSLPGGAQLQATMWRTGGGDWSTRRIISNFSATRYLMRCPSQPRSRFFSAAGFSSVSSATTSLQRASLPPQLVDLFRNCGARGVAGQALLAGLQKIPWTVVVIDDDLVSPPMQFFSSRAAAGPGARAHKMLARRYR